MTAAEQEAFKAQLEALRTELCQAEALGQTAQSTVELDQQSTGRLSRMDALQHQAMAQATSRQRQNHLRRIEAALARMEDDEFGYCLDCGEEIAAARLELDPTVPRCISCAIG